MIIAGWGMGGGADFDLEEIFWRAVDFFEALLAGIRHCLHGEDWLYHYLYVECRFSSSWREIEIKMVIA